MEWTPLIYDAAAVLIVLLCISKEQRTVSPKPLSRLRAASLR